MIKTGARKPRSYTIHMDPRNYFEFEALVMDFKTQKIMGLKHGRHHPLIGKSRLEFKRDREYKEPKILHASNSATGDVWFNTNEQLFSYDHLIAVDTNTNQVNGASVSITAAYHIIPRCRNSKNVFCHARVLALVELWNVMVKPENLGWWQILQAIEKHPEEYSGKIGLIVDSDLGNHCAFNERQTPIVADYYLPDNVTIIYGSDKGGGEHLSTKAIKYCHDLASDLYRNKNLIMNVKGLALGLEGLYTHIRQWDVESNDLRPFC
ncbi:hypothetical protein QSV34_10650 [Porticoccus sp. W117]|uniref:hypothetical protein n=1 Tax=Porticoccus sp. W117 TaxID=3054777 RepID=UPI0025940DE5|nr:hypothetical protein [Porticoccus sp. W117]MDM3871810.1 hypothetical protein [Porticoccus sp. W117]